MDNQQLNCDMNDEDNDKEPSPPPRKTRKNTSGPKNHKCKYCCIKFVYPENNDNHEQNISSFW